MTWSVSAIAMAAAAVISAGVSYAGNQQNMRQQKKIAKAQEAQAELGLKSAEQEFNAQNQKEPDTGSLLSSQIMSGKAGQSGTMLTGSGGIDKDALALRRKTLLGQ